MAVELILNGTFNLLRTSQSTGSRDLGVMLSLDGAPVPRNPFRTAQAAA